jgi:hypothetical protein
LEQEFAELRDILKRGGMRFLIQQHAARPSWLRSLGRKSEPGQVEIKSLYCYVRYGYVEEMAEHLVSLCYHKPCDQEGGMRNP